MLSGQRNTTPNTRVVFAVGAIKQTMDVTEVKQLGGTPLGMVGACSGTSSAPPVVPVAPGRCPRTVPPNTGRGVVPLAREGPTARFRHNDGTYWEQSKRVFSGRDCERFREEFNVLEAGGCCTDSTVHGKHRAVVCRGCLRFLLWPSIAMVRYSDIYRAIPTWVPRLPMLRFGDRRGVQLLRMGWLVHSPLTIRIWASRRQGGGADRAV